MPVFYNFNKSNSNMETNIKDQEAWEPKETEKYAIWTNLIIKTRIAELAYKNKRFKNC